MLRKPLSLTITPHSYGKSTKGFKNTDKEILSQKPHHDMCCIWNQKWEKKSEISCEIMESKSCYKNLNVASGLFSPVA